VSTPRLRNSAKRTFPRFPCFPIADRRRRWVCQSIGEDGERRWFVCGALARQRVRIERIGAKLLVSYRHMYIREIDKERACTRPLLAARQDGGAAGQGDPPVALPPEPKLKCKGCLGN